jgi:hypothetical protein
MFARQFTIIRSERCGFDIRCKGVVMKILLSLLLVIPSFSPAQAQQVQEEIQQAIDFLGWAQFGQKTSN